MTTTFPLESPVRPRGVRRVLLESAYSLSAFPIALAAFVRRGHDLTLGLALTIFIGGILLIALAIMVARGFARFERIRHAGHARPRGRHAGLPLRPARLGFWRRH